MAWSDREMIRDIITTLATQGWEKILEDDLPLDFIERLAERFATPLQGAQVHLNTIKEEFKFLLQYAVQFISLATIEYRAVWWRIFHSPSASEWSNVLVLVQLLFSLLASNGKLECIFSQMNVIKTNKRSLFSNESLDDLLLLSIDGPPLKDFSSDLAIDLWWNDKVRKPNQKPRTAASGSCAPTSSAPSPQDNSQSEEESSDNQLTTDLLTEWDTLMT